MVCARAAPTSDVIVRLVGAVLAEQHDEWVHRSRYMTLASLEEPLKIITKNVINASATTPVEQETAV